MLLTVAIPTGVASAVAYGFSTAVQHDTVSAASGEHAPAGLRRVLRDPRWWASIGGDTVGLVLQLVALAFGPVVLVQPLFVLCLLVALPVRRRLGGPPVTGRDVAGCVVLVAALAALFALLARPGAPRAVPAATSLLLSLGALGAGGVLVGLARGLPATLRALCWSALAGMCFGVEAVLVNVVSEQWTGHGLAAFGRPDGLVPLVGAIVVGLTGFAIGMAAFGAGDLGASFPAMLVVDPVLAVVLGATLLGEHVPASPAHLAGYAVCGVLIAAATVELARPGRAVRPGAGVHGPRPGSRHIS